jgi:hypothetical protein
MNTKRIAVSIVLPLCLMLCSCRSNEEIVSHARWQPAPIVADGFANEWEIPLQYYSKGGKVGCAVANDHSNLYICIRSSDQETRMKMIRSGMTVSIDTSGKKTNLFSVNYPLAKEGVQHSREDMKAMMNKETKVSDFPSRKQHILQDQKIMRLSGFMNTQNGENPLKTPSGLSVCMNLDSFDVFTYEAVIPFKTFYKEQLSSTDTSSVLTIYITVNGMGISGGGGTSAGRAYGGGGVRMGAGGGGRMGGGRSGTGGGHSMPASGDLATMSEPDKLQVTFRLNFK